VSNPYIPHPAVIKEVRDETDDVKTFKIKFKDKKRQTQFNFKPGQFVELSIMGIGEAPISICSSPEENTFFELAVKRIGNVTDALHLLKPGSIVGVRGPYGNGWPIKELKGKNIVVVAGGIALAPLRGLIQLVLSNRSLYKKLYVLYGARTPKDIVFKEDLKSWSEGKEAEVHVTVDTATDDWKGNVGVVTTLFSKIDIPVEGSIALTCGPPIMMRFVVKTLKSIGFENSQITVSLERLMRCGIGKCGHCMIGEKFVCLDGPIFNYAETTALPTELT
jgi:sulfhydrogenase subunit gamma (sulfur reductase)